MGGRGGARVGQSVNGGGGRAGEEVSLRSRLAGQRYPSLSTQLKLG